MKRSTFFGIVYPTAVAMAAMLLASTAAADTVAWWHFDEEAPGTMANSGVVTESISGTTAASYTAWSNQVSSTDHTYFPAFGPAFTSLAVYDPVTGTTNANRSAMKFKIARGGATPDTSGGRAYYGGALKVNKDTLYTDCTGAVTIEAFVCTDGGGSAFNGFAPIVGCLASGNWTGEKWAIYMETDGRVAVRFNGNVWYNESGNQDNRGTVKINDGRWHHVALTWDGSTIKIYIDYAIDKKFTDGSDRAYSKGGTIDYTGTATWIGGYGSYANSNGGRRYPGLIDEIRVSNTALTPDQFLRLVPPAEADSDTVLHLRFDHDTDRAIEEDEVVGGTIGGQQVFYKAISGAYTSTYDTSEKAGGTIAYGLYSDVSADDVASYCQFTNATGMANYLKATAMSDHLFPDDVSSPTNFNYTVEAFFKANSPGGSRQTIFKFGSSNSCMPAHVITGEGGRPHQIQFCYGKGSGYAWTDGGYSPSSNPYDDGNWHHVAFVSDASNSLIRTYYDYVLVSQQTNVYVQVAKGYSLFIGSKENGSGQFFDGWIDDVRVMKRALRPEEFLTTHSVGSATPHSLLLAKFEQNYDFVCEADAALSVTGTGSARTGGSVPTFEKVSPGALLLDGTNGSERVDNEWSVRLNTSRVVFPVSRLYENDAYTVEFWAKFTGYDGDRAPDYKTSGQHAGILRFVQGTATTLDWYLYRPGDELKALQVAVRNADGTIPTSNYLKWSLPNIVADSRWHHYALSFRPTDGNSKTAIELYYDYRSRGTNTIDSLMHFNAGGHRLMVGESSTDAMPNILGYVNSLRFWRGVIAPDKFLGRVPRGTVVVLR